MEGGPPSFPQTHRGSWYSGCQPVPQALPLRDSHPLWWRLPTPSSQLGSPAVGPTTPCRPKPPWFGLLPPRSPLRRESRLISLRRATEMFQFARCPPACLCVQQAVSRHHSGRVAPFGSSGLIARMQLPLNVSPVSASFIGLQRQGIHRVLCCACAACCVSVRCSSLSSSTCILRARALPLLLVLALGKIEVIVIYFCNAVVKVRVRGP